MDKNNGLNSEKEKVRIAYEDEQRRIVDQFSRLRAESDSVFTPEIDLEKAEEFYRKLNIYQQINGRKLSEDDRHDLAELLRSAKNTLQKNGVVLDQNFGSVSSPVEKKEKKERRFGFSKIMELISSFSRKHDV